MKKILIIASLALCCSLLASCEDFLDTKKYGAKTDWETQEDVEKALVALFSFNTNDSEGVTGRGITWFECCSDDMTVGRPQGEAEDIRNFRMSPSNGRDVKNNWKIMYEVNAKANNIIKVVPTMNLDNAFKTKATGTAYFFRGFAMLWLSPYYGDNGPNGGIPIILDTTEPAAMDSPRPASVLQNYDQIISDLREAGKRLPLFSQLAPEEYGMPHKAAAWAFAARAALYAAQFDAKYYDTVIEMCDKVMGLTGADKRELFDDGTDKAFANLWRKQQNFGCEYIFSLLGVKTKFSEVEGERFPTVSIKSHPCMLPRLDYDFSSVPDLAQPVVVTCALRGIPFRFTGLATLRIKETDRIEALKRELRKLGYVLRDENGDTLVWDGTRCEPTLEPIDTYDDHRMAMAFAPAAIVFPGLRINEPQVVTKSYPQYWEDMQKAGFEVKGCCCGEMVRW